MYRNIFTILSYIHDTAFHSIYVLFVKDAFKKHKEQIPSFFRSFSFLSLRHDMPLSYFIYFEQDKGMRTAQCMSFDNRTRQSAVLKASIRSVSLFFLLKISRRVYPAHGIAFCLSFIYFLSVSRNNYHFFCAQKSALMA